MTKVCGECNLCCKLESIMELNKAPGILCKHYATGQGCLIYKDRPKACKSFQCLWLVTPEMPDELRPDRVHHYVTGDPANGYLKVCVDPAHPLSWDGCKVTDYVTGKGLHALVYTGDQVTFVQGKGAERPKLIKLDWTL